MGSLGIINFPSGLATGAPAQNGTGSPSGALGRPRGASRAIAYAQCAEIQCGFPVFLNPMPGTPYRTMSN